MSAIAPAKTNNLATSILANTPQLGGFEALRDAAISGLNQVEFPTLRAEVWKYTKVSGLLKKEFVAPVESTATLSAGTEALTANQTRLVFVNGLFHAALSNFTSSANVSISTLAADGVNAGDVTTFDTNWEGEQEAFTLLNEASFTDGVFIKIAKNHKAEAPIFIVHTTTGDNASATTRNYFEVASGAEATVINLYENQAGVSFTNVFNGINIAENAHAHWFDYHQNAAEANVVATTIANQQGNSNLNVGSYLFEGKLIRKNIYVNVLGQNATTTANGSYILNDKQVGDHRVILDHKAAHCESNQMFKGVVSGKATGVFNGKIYVRKDSQIINAFQNNRNILLSDDANVYSRPQLEIYADDVKCSHGSTTGQLDQEALFYLMARGIRRVEAEKLLVQAFTADAIENVEYEPLAEVISNAIAHKTAQL
jgi:Fe-S cluster assembly protein SufD